MTLKSFWEIVLDQFGSSEKQIRLLRRYWGSYDATGTIKGAYKNFEISYYDIGVYSKVPTFESFETYIKKLEMLRENNSQEFNKLMNGGISSIHTTIYELGLWG